MPTRVPDSRIRVGNGRLVLILAVALTAGCGLDPGVSTEDGTQASREQYDTRITILPPPNPAPAPPEVSVPEVPQDPVALERERAARRERLSVYYVSAYEQFGHKDPRWDEAAR